MKYLYSLLIPLYSYAHQTRGELELFTGPGFAFSYVRLLPTPYDPATNSFLQSINEQTAWNLLACLGGVAACKLPCSFSLNAELEGRWIRHGQSTITDSSITPINEFSDEYVVELSSDALKVRTELNYHATLPKSAKVSAGAGYLYEKESAQLSYLNKDLSIFSRIYYQGPSLQITLSQRFERLQFSLNYRFVSGRIRMMLTQRPNPFNATVFRSAPQAIGNIFTINIMYQYSACLSFGQKITYHNVQNHARGCSTTYQNGLPPVTLRNVDSMTQKRLQFSTSVTYEF